MRHKANLSRKANSVFAFVVDGKCESWYLSLCNSLEKSLKIKLEPKLPQQKKIEEQYKLVKDMLDEGYDKVFWVVDFDTLNKEQLEARKGENLIAKFAVYYKKLRKENNVVVIINNPCFEYWILLHFEQTAKYYENYEHLLYSLKRYLPDYEKTERYYKKNNNDIYTRLKPQLLNAIENANKLSDFEIENTHVGLSQMHKFFELEVCGEKILRRIF